ncbi:MAG: hypothetical protein KDJ55_02500 [Rhodobiaceae bacterium]|nr:hypothetical protein [Rhodobiaceae bacterium]MCC0012116.1 hypothetical protein [Rhodobiaceae bacterium]MCC0060968.1 hypothetical protein [Rhodobiaceae bacterium]
MIRTALAFALAMTLLLPGTVIAKDLTGPALITVTGKVGTPNRNGLDPFMDAYFNFQQKAFSEAHAFTFADLKTLPQHTVTANAEDWPAPVRASGPLLADVMAAAGVSADATLAFGAIDGYTVELDQAARDGQPWILAIEAGGKPLALGGRGPAWLLHETGEAAASSDEEARWVWSIIMIEAK